MIKEAKDHPSMSQCHNSLCNHWNENSNHLCALGGNIFSCTKSTSVWTKAGIGGRRIQQTEKEKERSQKLTL